MSALCLHLPIGWMRIRATARGLCEASFLDAAIESRRVAGPGAEHLQQAREELEGYFAGDLLQFGVSLDLQGTDFQKRAWEVLREIPFGETLSYQAQARRIGSPQACRAVGAANGKNPLAIFIPCHRVIGKTGSLTGYRSGLERKRFLLRWEQEVLARKRGAG